MPDILQNIILELRKMYADIQKPLPRDVNHITEILNKRCIQFARTGELVADTKYMYRRAKDSNLEYSQEELTYNLAANLSSALSKQIDACRTLISLEKERMGRMPE